MPLTTLSAVVQANPAAINSSLEKLSCSAAGIDEIDIYPAVLSALTSRGAPRTVATEARAVVQLARSSRTQKRKDGAATTSSSAAAVHSTSPTGHEDSYMESFNVGIAMSLHTVLLSRNRITSLLGIVQFKHCVRLSLMANRIRTLEDCEPLAMLPDLQYLSLEYNPVTQLPHYRAHLLRLCAWPHELTTHSCRLRKLDSTVVTPAEVKHAVLCLQREQSLLPELLYRTQLLAFLGDMERRQSVHRELRQRGFVFQQTCEPVSLEATLERGAAYALARVPVGGPAHLVRLLVRDRHRHTTAQSVPRRPFSGKGTRLETETATFCTAHDKNAGSASITTNITEEQKGDADGGELPETSNITSLSSVASCSFFTDQSEGDAQMAHSLPSLLGAGELEWSRTALRAADASAARSTCIEWSRDAFRQALAFLDVRICAVLLRVARGLSQSLNAHDVDRLCQVWLHAVTHYTDVGEGGVNATGPRRLVGPGRSAALAKKRQEVDANAVSVTGREAEKERGDPAADTGTKKASCDAIQPVAAPQLSPRPSSRLPVEAAAPLHVKSVWAVGEQDGCLSPSLSTLPAASDDVSDVCADISTTSLSSDSALEPRETAPVPIAVGRLASPRRTTSPHTTEELREYVLLPHSASPPALTRSAECPPPAATKDETADAVAATLAPTADKFLQLRTKQRTFQQWCTALRHRWQSRIVVAYIRDKIEEAAVQQRLSRLRSPAWSGLLKHVTYVERKRGYFLCWRRRARVLREAREQEQTRVADAWHAHSAGAASLHMHDTHANANTSSGEVRRCTLRVVFAKWKTRAEQQALTRCTTARQRLLATSSGHTPETFLSLPPRSPIGGQQKQHQSTPSTSSPVVPRHLLDDLLKTSDRQRNAARSPSSDDANKGKNSTSDTDNSAGLSPSPSRGGFRRCNLPAEQAVKVTRWQPVSTTPSAATAHKGASSHTMLEGVEDAISPVAASSSNGGVSVNSITTPFLSEAPPSSPPQPQPTLLPSVPFAKEARQPRDSSPEVRAAHEQRELSPPPAIRILFPNDAGMNVHTPSPLMHERNVGKQAFIGVAQQTGFTQSPTPVYSPPVERIFVAGKSAARLYGGSQPSRLPSTTAARRAIIVKAGSHADTQPSCATATAFPDTQTLQKVCVQRHEQVAHAATTASPYPPEDVEALVARAKQLETDRVFLLSEVQRLSRAPERGRNASSPGTPQPFSPPLPANPEAASSPLPPLDAAEERYEAQRREIQRLESVVLALRDERHNLLKSVKSEIFQY